MNAADWRADVERVLHEVGNERGRQDARWGEQNHPDGTGPDLQPFLALRTVSACEIAAGDLAEEMTARTDVRARRGTLTYEAILTEEWAEALACSDPGELRVELLQVAAVAVAWVQKIDRDGAQ